MKLLIGNALNFNMVRELNMDTQRQNFWKESINKEVSIRNTWFQQHLRFSKEFAAEDLSSPVPVSKAPEPVKVPSKVATPKKASPVPVAEPEPGTKFTEMRIASPLTKTILYTGLSAEGDGRKAYLLQRKTKGPEEKFEFPITSASEVGWKIREVSSNQEVKPAMFGRSRIVQDTFFRTNGVLNHDSL